MSTTPETLLERVRQVPERQRAATHRDAYRHLKQQLDEMQQMLDRAEAAELGLTEVFGAASPQSERGAARRALANLTKAFGALSADGDPKGLADLQRAARHALTGFTVAAERAWQAEVSEFSNRYAGMLALLVRMGLPLATEAQAAATMLRQQTEPPRSEGDRRRASQAVTTIRMLMTRLGGGGEAEPEGLRFLRQVGEGRATAQQLLAPDVQAFLSEHKLWPLLKVTVA
jgi:hypothetical protein